MNWLLTFLIILLHILCICDLRAKPIVTYGGGGGGATSMVSTATTITALPIIIAKLALASQDSDLRSQASPAVSRVQASLQNLKSKKAKAYPGVFYSQEHSGFHQAEGETENYAAEYSSNSIYDLSSSAAESAISYDLGGGSDEFETIKMQTNNHQRPEPALSAAESESNSRYYSANQYGLNWPGSGQAKFGNGQGRHGKPLRTTVVAAAAPSQAASTFQQPMKGLYQNDINLHYAYGLVGKPSPNSLGNLYSSLPSKISHYSNSNSALVSNLIAQPNSSHKLNTLVKDHEPIGAVGDLQYQQVNNTASLGGPSDDYSSGLTCGRQQIAGYREPRIVGGNSTYHGEFPWAVSIQRHGNHHCGGVIVGKRWILTAAHCVRSQFVGNLVVRTGGHSLSKFNGNNINSHLERNYFVDQIVMHGDFSRYDNLTTSQLKSSATTNNGDIALLKLAQDIQWNELAWPVCTPTREVGNFSGHDAVVIGWGKLTEKSEDFSNDLQKVKLTIIDNKLCQNWFRQAGRDMPIDERIICAGFKNGGKDACHGDSGGPLLSKIRGQYVVVGVVSTGIGCARPLLPGLYSRVSSYVDWIESHTCS